MSKNYYDVLGVSKDSDKAHIKKAFREKAKKYHPDKGGDEAKFKEINEAYEVLSSDSKRQQYDQFGSAGAGGFSGGGGAQGFSGDFSDMFGGGQGGGGFEDIFGSFFGGGGSRQQQTGPAKGSDLEVTLRVTFDDAMKGVKESFPITSYVNCEKCSAKGGDGEKTCETCKGQGSIKQQFQTPLGVISQQAACPTCKGKGKIFENTCSNCKGEGRYEKKHKITVDIPAGVDDGEVLVVKGSGDAGRQGGPSGDLYVRVGVSGSKKFHRRGIDILSELDISVVDALLGGAFDVETFWGKVKLTVPENTPDRQVLRIRGKGVKRGSQTGDHMVSIRYTMPKKLSKKAREQLEVLKKSI